MSYVSFSYLFLVLAALVVYYLFPPRKRWLVLLAASFVFYYFASGSIWEILVFAGSVLVSYAAALWIRRLQLRRPEKTAAARLVLALGILVSAGPLIVSKCADLLSISVLHTDPISWIVPVGLSFYSMQVVAYLVDVYRKQIDPQTNVLKYALFVSYFPIIIQGPISRARQLGASLLEEHRYNSKTFMRGIQLLLWGFFLKYVIADKAAIVVNQIFSHPEDYSGAYILIAGILYSLQLYTDFLSCVTMSQGVSGLFGVEIADNFQRPYFSGSIKEFWRRWHISLSSWLRDYIYIPLGGSRRGKMRKYINLILTFLVSGLWHGNSLKFLVWGLVHACYQIIGDLLEKPKNYVWKRIALPEGSKLRRVLGALTTSFLVMLCWILFRANSLMDGLSMLKSLFTTWNPWVLFDDSLLRLGLNQKQWIVLTWAVVFLLIVSFVQERGIVIRDWFARQNLLVRWILYLAVFSCIWVFGTYGFGFEAADFIYGGF